MPTSSLKVPWIQILGKGPTLYSNYLTCSDDIDIKYYSRRAREILNDIRKLSDFRLPELQSRLITTDITTTKLSPTDIPNSETTSFSPPSILNSMDLIGTPGKGVGKGKGSGKGSGKGKSPAFIPSTPLTQTSSIFSAMSPALPSLELTSARQDILDLVSSQDEGGPA